MTNYITDQHAVSSMMLDLCYARKKRDLSLFLAYIAQA